MCCRPTQLTEASPCLLTSHILWQSLVTINIPLRAAPAIITFGPSCACVPLQQVHYHWEAPWRVTLCHKCNTTLRLRCNVHINAMKGKVKIMLIQKNIVNKSSLWTIITRTSVTAVAFTEPHCTNMESQSVDLPRLWAERFQSILLQLTRRSILGSDCIDSYFDALTF